MADFTPRPYQVLLMKIALEKNTVIYLPTGSGKTFIAVLVLKQMCAPLLKKYSEGGKISVMLVNSVPLVDQHAKYISNHTVFKVGQYTGEMNIDIWPKDRWYEEYDKHQVLIMTSQILLNNITANFIDMNKVNLLIFDECHHGVNDHPMRSIMKSFKGLEYPPRVLGLTATLLNKNIGVHKVLEEVQALETTFHGQVATVDGLSDVLGYSTNPKEDFVVFNDYFPTHIEKIAINLVERLKRVVKAFKEEVQTYTLSHMTPLNESVGFRELNNMLDEIVFHIKSFGIYGGIKASISYMIQVESLKKSCQNLNLYALLNTIITNLSFIKDMLTKNIKKFYEKDQIMKFSSDKILGLINIFREFPRKSNEELCAIIFTKRRFTAKILYHILEGLRKCHPEFEHIKPDYIVGYNNNPYNSTRESLFISKKNKEVIEAFRNKEINVIVSSSVLEEGVDMQKCTLVVRYDLPEDYRGYIQSKGRARHKDSLYYMMVEKSEYSKFSKKYRGFQEVEEALNKYLIGKNKEREEPSGVAINKMYGEDPIPPYYVAGENSAYVDMHSAIPLLCQYCSMLPSDIYTTYAPEWYVQWKKNIVGERLTSIVILLPIVSPLRETIEGMYMKTIKDAKKAAALEACKRLHQIGELDDHLLPKKQILCDEDVQFLFKHYPDVKEEKAGFVSNRRLCPVQAPQCLKGYIRPNIYYLHIINIRTKFERPTDVHDSTMHDTYNSPTCYGILTPSRVPRLCDFPIYVTLGTLDVSFKINQNEIFLDEDALLLIKRFHLTVFDGVIKVLQRFLLFDNGPEAEIALIVPVNKHSNIIDFEILRGKYDIKDIVEPTSDEKQQLEVTQQTYLRKIVVPWYRESSDYIVTEVCLNKSALSLFPNQDYGTYKDYFVEKHSRLILCPNLPLLLVKGLTKRLNFIKPRGRETTKRKREKLYEEMTEHLLPELVVKQDFPSELWIQASFLPTILSRFTYMLRLEELRCKIATEAGLGQQSLDIQPALTVDEYLLRYDSALDQPEENIEVDTLPIENNVITSDVSLAPLHINKDFAAKVLEAEYPWKNIEEPKNILKSLDVTPMEIEHYQAFISQRIDVKENVSLRNDMLNTTLAITYPADFKAKKISMLENSVVDKGPTLKDIYGALTCAKADDIVNLERLETLGDSFLKLISSVYVTLSFPNFNEGKATQLKGRLVSNKNLYYLAKNKNLPGIMQFTKLSPKENWVPPAFKSPDELSTKILKREISINNLYNFSFSMKEQLNGTLSEENLEMIENDVEKPDDTEEASYSNLDAFLKCQYIGDKFVSDTFESLLGCYLQTSGFQGAIKFLEWTGFFPKSVKMKQLLKEPSPNPVLNRNATQRDILFHIPNYKIVENTLGYRFNNKAYLLQALTHSSYATNRITLSYEKLEFLGDAILDFLITCYIYESCGKLDPGELTDLRSALVNNNTFASLIVRNGLHKHLLMINSTLQNHIDKFVEFSKCKNHEIDNEIMILLSEDELSLAEYVDVPKVLGDIFEALAGAIYLDCDKDLKKVWEVFYKLMWKEIELFSKDVPKNSVRMLFEKQGLYPEFKQPLVAKNNKSLVPLQFKLDGRTKTVYGCGTNKAMARRAAAKLALRCLDM